LEQYLRFFIEYKQRDWPEQLAIAEFAVNNKVHSVTKVLPFIVKTTKSKLNFFFIFSLIFIFVLIYFSFFYF